MVGQRKKNRRYGKQSTLRRMLGKPVFNVWKSASWLIARPFIWIRDLLRFLGAIAKLWWTHRDSRYYLRALPAFLLLSGTLFLGYISYSQPPGQLLDDYRKAAQSAFESKNYSKARLFFDRVVQIGDASDELLYQLAISATQTGDTQRADVLITKLAPEDSPGYAPAQIVRAKFALQNSRNIPETRIVKAKTHLLNAIAANTRSLEAHLMLGNIYMQQQIYDEAIQKYLTVAESNPSYRLLLAKAYALNGDEIRGKTQGELARDDFARALSKKPQHEEVRIALADSLMFLEEYHKSINALREGLPYKNSDALRKAIARVYLAWSDSLPSKTEQDQRRRFELLSQALLFDTRDLRLFERMMSVLEREDQLSDDARKFLIKNTTNGNVSKQTVAISYLLLGTDEGQKKNYKQAAYFIKRAQEKDPTSSLVANNLAWYLAIQKEPELETALQLIEQTIKSSRIIPAHFYDTQGFILYEMGKFESAINAYSKVLEGRGLSNDPFFHERIAKAYEKVGQPALAQSHWDRSKVLHDVLKREQERKQKLQR